MHIKILEQDLSCYLAFDDRIKRETPSNNLSLVPKFIAIASSV